MGLQQHLPRFTGQAFFEGAQGVPRAAQALLQTGPGLGVSRVQGQPGIEALLHPRIRFAGAQAHHPVDGLLADRVQARLAHGASSAR